jgi:hypothetical protein
MIFSLIFGYSSGLWSTQIYFWNEKMEEVTDFDFGLEFVCLGCSGIGDGSLLFRAPIRRLGLGFRSSRAPLRGSLSPKKAKQKTLVFFTPSALLFYAPKTKPQPPLVLRCVEIFASMLRAFFLFVGR